ncbi:ribonuclease Z [Pseudoflavonifractor sp. 524-17]|nr:ribonuclease Z [Pseudoflavonifractor sp. 524-17]
MIAIVCIDDKGGMLFHGRRQSRDRAVRADVIQMTAGRRLWMNAYSQKQFSGENVEVTVDERFLDLAEEGEFCFVEDRPIRPCLDRLERLVLYRWNRIYPADVSLDIFADMGSWRLAETCEFPGHSHEIITKEVYIL